MDNGGRCFAANFRWRRILIRAIAEVFDLSLRTMYRIEVRGIENYTLSPSTLVVANHRRDADGPIIYEALMKRRGPSTRNYFPTLVAREDLFRRGFLSGYLKSWPRLLRQAVLPFSLAGFLKFVQAYPLRRIPERTLGEVLESVLQIFGDLPLSAVLKKSWIEEFERPHSPGRETALLSEILSSPHYREMLRKQYGLTKLKLSRFRALKPFERAKIAEQLSFFIDVLKRGGVVQLAPEGVVSQDGSFSRLRGGLHFMLNGACMPMRVLPVGITYDLMITGRERVFVNIGSEITNLQGLSRRDTDTRVAQAILSCNTVTASQLASQFLVSRSEESVFTSPRLADYVGAEAKRCAEAGAFVDPRLLNDRARKRRVRQYLKYCTRLGLLAPVGRFQYRVRNGKEIRSSGTSNPDRIIRYVNNELKSLTCLWAGKTESAEA